MTARTLDLPASPYLMAAPPESIGRVLLASGFAHYCVLHWGYDPSEVAEGLQGGGNEDVRNRVAFAARLLGGVLARGFVKAWTRAIGGGEPTVLRASVWEIDDFTHRFATSAIDPAHPFDRDAPVTHWIFVDLEDWNAIMAASVDDGNGRRRTVQRAPVSGDRPETMRSPEVAPSAGEDRLIRLPEVKRLTGMSRSTIYRRMKIGTFPESIPLSANISVWRERAIAAWVSDLS